MRVYVCDKCARVDAFDDLRNVALQVTLCGSVIILKHGGTMIDVCPECLERLRARLIQLVEGLAEEYATERVSRREVIVTSAGV